MLVPGLKCFLSTTHFAKIGMGCDLDFIRLYIKEMYASKLCWLVPMHIIYFVYHLLKLRIWKHSSRARRFCIR